MKKPKQKFVSLKGHPVLVEYIDDFGHPIWIEGFVAQDKEDVGMTIKALDPEACPAYFKNQKEFLNNNDINLMCIDFKLLAHKKILAYRRKFIKQGKLSLKVKAWSKKMADYQPFDSMAPCAFQ